MVQQQNNPHRLELQGLRAVAISAVLLYHFFPELCPNGFVGVDIFFVLSGYLISSILRRQIEENCNGLSLGILKTFYYRRLKRIVPLHLLYCFGAALLIMFFSDPFRIPADREAALYALPFLTNIRALFDRADYFKAVKSDSLFTHIWSLSMEVQFYLIAPFLFVLLPKKSRLLAVIMISFACYVIGPFWLQFNAMPLRLWQFLAAAVHIFDSSKNDNMEDKKQKASLLGEITEDVEVGHSIYFKKKTPCAVSRWLPYLLIVAFVPMTMPQLLVRVLVTIAAAAFIHSDARELTSLLRRPSFVFLGDVSYSLYLIHWPVVTFILDMDYPFFFPTRLANIPLSLAITVLVHDIFEKRYRQWPKNQIVCCCSLLVLLTIGTLFAAQPVNDRLYPVSPDIAEAVEKNMKFFEDPQANLMIPECNYYAFRGASNSSTFLPPHGACDMPEGTGKLRFAVIGNSYAPDHAKMIWQAFKPFFSAFRIFSEGGCEVLSMVTPHSLAGCQLWYNYTDVLDDLKPDVTFIVQRYNVPRDYPIPKGKDWVYDDMLEHYRWIQNKSSFFYIIEPMASPDFFAQRRLIGMLRRHMSSRAINKRVIQEREDLTNANPRVYRLGKECANCVVYQVMKFLENMFGQTELVEFESNLALMEPYSHLTPRGRERLLPAYEQHIRVLAGGLLRRPAHVYFVVKALFLVYLYLSQTNGAEYLKANLQAYVDSAVTAIEEYLDARRGDVSGSSAEQKSGGDKPADAA